MVRDSVDLLAETWKKGTKPQKLALLKARGLHPSWAKTKSINEMVQRGGGAAVMDLHSLTKEWRKRNPEVKVMFD